MKFLSASEARLIQHFPNRTIYSTLSAEDTLNQVIPIETCMAGYPIKTEVQLNFVYGSMPRMFNIRAVQPMNYYPFKVELKLYYRNEITPYKTYEINDQQTYVTMKEHTNRIVFTISCDDNNKCSSGRSKIALAVDCIMM